MLQVDASQLRITDLECSTESKADYTVDFPAGTTAAQARRGCTFASRCLKKEVAFEALLRGRCWAAACPRTPSIAACFSGVARRFCVRGGVQLHAVRDA